MLLCSLQGRVPPSSPEREHLKEFSSSERGSFRNTDPCWFKQIKAGFEGGRVETGVWSRVEKPPWVVGNVGATSG